MKEAHQIVDAAGTAKRIDGLWKRERLRRAMFLYLEPREGRRGNQSEKKKSDRNDVWREQNTYCGTAHSNTHVHVQLHERRVDGEYQRHECEQATVPSQARLP